MEEIEVEVRRWGNSLGILIPADTVRREGIQPRDRVFVRIQKIRYPDPAAFGSLRHLKIDAQAMKDEIRREDRRRDDER